MISSKAAGQWAWILIIVLISGLATGVKRDVNSVSSDGYTDQNRPYKFAFAIEGYQHRMEQKDEKGIIMGEFGFVTGDGVYHETVYATDENGNFRILSMKNYYIGLPGEGMTSMSLPTEPPTTPQPRLAPQTTPKKIELSGIQGCSGCRIPTTNAPDSIRTQPNLYENKINVDERFGNNQRTNINPDKNKNYPLTPNLNIMSRPENKANNPFIKNMIQTSLVAPPKSPTVYPVNEVAMKKYAPGIKPELPEQKSNVNKVEMVKSGDRSGLLYEFNQTQTFQGHHEKGYVDNSKEGNYFVNQRDGIKQVVEYIANDSGYQPYIKFVNLTASETPDPKTEKIRNMLETMYFKWFYGKG